jgi:hypothetical protein
MAFAMAVVKRNVAITRLFMRNGAFVNAYSRPVILAKLHGLVN